jgi:hypothetical protein
MSFDLLRIKELFQFRAASPKDHLDGVYGPETLVEVLLAALDHVFYSTSSSSRMVHQQGIDMIRFLLPFYRDIQPCASNYNVLNSFGKLLWTLGRSEAQDLAFLYVELTRDILRQCEENPLGHAISVIHIDLEKERYPISTLFLEQTYHSMEFFGASDNYSENDRFMLTDPEGNKMKQVIQRGGIYHFSILGFFMDPWKPKGRRAAYAFIKVVNQSLHHPRFSEITVCSRNRLSFLIQAGFDTKNRAVIEYDSERCIQSLVGYALYLRQGTFLREAFAQAGWTKEQVNEIFEEEMYLGVSDLLDGTLQYLTREQCRKDFLRDLIDGKIDDLVPHEVALHVGADGNDIEALLTEAKQAIALKSTPGSWDDHEEICLVPGVDFEPYVWTVKPFKKIDIQDWLE